MDTSYLISLALISSLLVFLIAFISNDQKKAKVRVLHYRSPSIKNIKTKWKS
ncbi:MAG: hypothetical protein IAE90_11800 [Ignavibacteria bacterium]|nr:hypothetical protein [Ignavibacteria bacterium]